MDKIDSTVKLMAYLADGKNAVIIRDDQIVGLGQITVGDCLSFVGIRFIEGRIVDELKDLEPFKSGSMNSTFVFYAPVNGSFLSFFTRETPEFKTAASILEKTKMVTGANVTVHLPGLFQ